MTMTRKEFWIQAYIACLSQHGAKQAVDIADAALKECEARWKTPVVQGMVREYGDMPVAEADYNRSAIPFVDTPTSSD